MIQQYKYLPDPDEVNPDAVGYPDPEWGDEDDYEKLMWQLCALLESHSSVIDIRHTGPSEEFHVTFYGPEMMHDDLFGELLRADDVRLTEPEIDDNTISVFVTPDPSE